MQISDIRCRRPHKYFPMQSSTWIRIQCPWHHTPLSGKAQLISGVNFFLGTFSYQLTYYSEEVGDEWNDLARDDQSLGAVFGPDQNEPGGEPGSVHNWQSGGGVGRHRERLWPPPNSVRSGEPSSKFTRFDNHSEIHVFLSFGILMTSVICRTRCVNDSRLVGSSRGSRSDMRDDASSSDISDTSETVWDISTSMLC